MARRSQQTAHPSAQNVNSAPATYASDGRSTTALSCGREIGLRAVSGCGVSAYALRALLDLA
eukprot:4455837-Pyramimonas_sp.AAC.1